MCLGKSLLSGSSNWVLLLPTAKGGMPQMSASHDFFNMILIQIAGSRSSNRVYRRNLNKYSCLLTEGPNVSCGRGESRQNWSLLAALQMFSRISHTHEPLLVCFLENITISVDQGRIVNVRPSKGLLLAARALFLVFLSVFIVY